MCARSNVAGFRTHATVHETPPAVPAVASECYRQVSRIESLPQRRGGLDAPGASAAAAAMASP
jgi:hypothetical protein